MISKDDVGWARASARKASPALLAFGAGLPPETRDAIWILTAFRAELRALSNGDAAHRGAIDDVIVRIEKAKLGAAENKPLDRGLAWLMRDHELPHELLVAMTEAATWDFDGRRYATSDALIDYAARAGAAFTIAIAVLLGRRRIGILDRAADLGIAFELTRIAANVGDDVRRGRIHLPIEWLEEAGVDVDRFASRPETSAGVKTVVERTVRLAERFYLRAEPGLRDVPFVAVVGVRAARYAGLSMCREIVRDDFDTIPEKRPLSIGRAIGIARRTLRPKVPHPLPLDPPSSLEAVGFLVRAAAR